MKFVVLLLVVGVSIADFASIKAPRLSPPYCPCMYQADFTCPPPPTDCELTDDYCGCCPVCARQEGQTCGLFSAGCRSGLTCVIPPCTGDFCNIFIGGPPPSGTCEPARTL
ncbi:insulin-like growth factor-binding protein 5 [Branchiostoma floridae]|uniref:Insulin-like growth factor-binding protein 5 n=1 Tax=Branchiostoma floridae TaxID=7739 RepID=A0A9J7LRU9_BRAFL|nr:insulin-like growth factor-binding protein 5 [Branchiostoma floridae]